MLDIYKLIFRFSIQKLIKFLSNESFLLILLQYLKTTQMERVHTRQVMFKNMVAYYRVAENLINFSQASEKMLAIVSKGVVFKHFELTEDLSLNSLQSHNESKQLYVSNVG